MSGSSSGVGRRRFRKDTGGIDLQAEPVLQQLRNCMDILVSQCGEEYNVGIRELSWDWLVDICSFRLCLDRQAK